jgi:steroid 5-alpha reductase family enzyme
VGLYRLVRCPNYFGEILVWLGSLLAGVPFLHAWWAWAASIVATLCLVLIMMGSTKRLEFQQDERYGRLPEYQDYVRSVPVLIPFIPVYTLKNIRVYLE